MVPWQNDIRFAVGTGATTQPLTQFILQTLWSGGISGRNRVRPAGKWAQGLTCQTATTPACHIQNVSGECKMNCVKIKK